MRRWFGVYVAAWACCAGGAAPAKDQTVLFEVPGAVLTQPFAINESGAITGFYQTGSSTACARWCPFLRQPDGSITAFPIAGGEFAAGLGINSSGAIVGSSSLGAFLRTPDGTMTTLSIPGSFAAARGITDDGTIAGDYQASTSNRQGFVRAPDGTVTTFASSDAPTLQVVGIDRANRVSGVLIEETGLSHGFVRRADGRITTFDAPGAGSGAAQGTLPLAMDGEGTIVGFWRDSENGQHSFSRAPEGTIVTFDPPGYSTSSAYAVAQSGRNPAIAGQIGTTVYLRSRSGSVKILGHKFIEVNAMNASGAVTGVWMKNEKAHQVGYLRMPD